jgi:hypothetical protein
MITSDRQICFESLPYKFNLLLGKGADGEVYSLHNHPNKVIKICVLYDLHFSIDEDFNRVQSILNELRCTDIHAYVNIHWWGKIYEGYRYTVNAPQKYILYYYVMDQLSPISEDEYKLFHSLLSHEDRNLIKDFSVPYVNNLLDALNPYLQFDKNKVIQFYLELKDSKLQQTDLHPRNIMKTKSGNYKIIDIDRCVFK